MEKSITIKGKGKLERIKNVALDLFYTQGYEKTSVQMIIQVAGISKGAFYHYFSSKADVIESIASGYIAGLHKITSEVRNNQSLSAIEKLNKLLFSAQQYRIEKIDEMKKIFLLMKGESNLIFRERMIEKTIINIVPEYEKILIQGIEEGTIHTGYPHECAELIMRWGTFYRNRIFELILSERNRENINQIYHLSFFVQDFLERLLGLEKGKFEVANAYLLYLKNESHNT
jgi:AcrR family transcriptional regulator